MRTSFVNDTRFILSNLKTMGWVLILLGLKLTYVVHGIITFGEDERASTQRVRGDDDWEPATTGS